jgi:hypothetical protein
MIFFFIERKTVSLWPKDFLNFFHPLVVPEKNLVVLFPNGTGKMLIQ